MELQTIQTDDITTIAVKGRLDTVTSQEFDSSVSQLNLTSGDVVIDCAEMEYISSAGLRSLITVLKRVKAADKELRLINLTPSVKPVFDMTGFSTLFNL